MDSFGIRGFVDVQTVDADGNVTQHVRQSNAMTIGALSSIFAHGMFEKPSIFRCEQVMSTVPANFTLDVDVNGGYAEDPNSGGTYSKQYNFRDGRGLNAYLNGISRQDANMNLFSAWAPNTLGIYLMDKTIDISPQTQVPPYLQNKTNTISDNVVCYSEGVAPVVQSGNEISRTLYAVPERGAFFPQHLIHTACMRRVEGQFQVKSVCWGGASFDPCVFGVRARIKGFDEAGKSHFYAIEHRLVGSQPQTIVWQESRIAPYYTGTSVAARDVTGYNITTGAKTEKFTLPAGTDTRYMGNWMQGVIIGNNAYSITRGTQGATTNLTISRYGSWKQGDNAATQTQILPVTRQASDDSPIIFPVLVHNLYEGKLEVFYTACTTSTGYEVHHFTLNPLTLLGTEEILDMPYCIGQNIVSTPGTVTTSSDSNVNRTSAVTFTGFLDAYTLMYHLPFSAFRHPTNGQTYAVPSWWTEYTWSQYHRIGIRCRINSGSITYGEEFYVCTLTAFTIYHIEADQGYDLAWWSYHAGRWYYGHNWGVHNGNRVLQWGYSQTGLGNTATLPTQFLPLSGEFCLTSTDDNYKYLDGNNGFSLVALSRVVCGVNLPGSGVYKISNDALYVTYGWSIGSCDTLPDFSP